MAQVLLIEDHEDTREIYRTILEIEGHDVLEASDGREGLDMVVQHEPDLVVLDLGLPIMDGWTVLTRIREDPGRDRIRVLIVTAHGDQETRRRILQSTCDGLLIKPVEPRRLAKAVGSCLSGEEVRPAPRDSPPGPA